MALFEGEDIITVDVVSVNIVDDIPNILSDAVLVAIAQEQSIANHIVIASIYGLTAVVQNYLRKGISQYYFGLPGGSISAGVIDRDDVLASINDDMGITTAQWGDEYPLVSNPVSMYIAYYHLEKEYGWTVKTNTATRPADGRVYGLISYEFQVIGDRNFVVVTMEAPNAGNPITWLIYIEYVSTSFYNVIYYVNADSTDKRYWVYGNTQITYPDLEFKKADYGKNYLPIVPIIINRRFVNDSDPISNPNYNEEIHLSCERQLKTTSVDLDEVSTALADNPDIDTIQAAFFMYAISVYTEKPASKIYLYDYFNDLIPKSGVDQATYTQWFNDMLASDPLRDAPINIQIINEVDGYFNTAFQYNYLTQTDVDDTGYSGEYETEWTDGQNPTVFAQNIDDGFGNIKRAYVIGENGNFIVRKPRFDTNGVTVLGYTQIVVHGLASKTTIYAFNESTLTVTRLAIEDPNYDPDVDPNLLTGFVLPINWELLKSIHGIKDDEILYDAMQLIMYAGNKQNLKWYETDTFLSFVKFIMTYLTVVLSLLGLTKAGLTVMQIALRALGSVLVGLAASYLLEEVGGTLGIILAAIVTIVGSYGINNGGFAGILDALLMPTIKQIMGMVYTVVNFAVQDIQNQLKTLAEDYSEWLESVAGTDDMLEAAEDLLMDNSMVDYAAVNYGVSSMSPNESPSDFIYRTTHLMNPGVLSLDMIDSFVDRALTLPKPAYS